MKTRQGNRIAVRHTDEAPGMRGRGRWVSFPRRFRKPGVYLLAGLTVASAGFFAGAPQASAAYNCPAGRICHFVRINQSKKMRWNAYMVMYNADTGQKYHEWQEKHGYSGSSPKSGAYVLWWWNVDPASTNVRIEITIDYIQNYTSEDPVTWYQRGRGWVQGTQTDVTKENEHFSVTNNNPDARLDPSKNHCFTLDPDNGLGYDPNDPQCT
jgi:hypothetical protein